MRWIVNPPLLGFLRPPTWPTRPNQDVTRGRKNGLDREKVHCGLHRWCLPLMCVCVALAKTMIAQQQLRQNHNRTPHRHLLALSHRKIIKKCKFAFFLLYPDIRTRSNMQQINSTMFNQCIFLSSTSIWMCYKCFLLFSKSKLIYW